MATVPLGLRLGDRIQGWAELERQKGRDVRNQARQLRDGVVEVEARLGPATRSLASQICERARCMPPAPTCVGQCARYVRWLGRRVSRWPVNEEQLDGMRPRTLAAHRDPRSLCEQRQRYGNTASSHSSPASCTVRDAWQRLRNEQRFYCRAEGTSSTGKLS
jgi:hypothetical protein